MGGRTGALAMAPTVDHRALGHRATRVQPGADDQEEYYSVFKKNLNSPEGVQEKIVNDCRNLTIDYWREVISFQKEYPEYIENHSIKKIWKPSHERFVDLVKPLKLQGYSKEEEDVFDKNIFK